MLILLLGSSPSPSPSPNPKQVYGFEQEQMLSGITANVRAG